MINSWNNWLWGEMGSLRCYIEENDLDNDDAKRIILLVRDEMNKLIAEQEGKQND